VFLPTIRAWSEDGQLPTLAYLAGTDTKDDIRIIGRINVDGLVEDITLHGPSYLLGYVNP
jgi:hypothetical protein